MMLERGFILPNYDFKKPNDKIPFSKWHLKVRPIDPYADVYTKLIGGRFLSANAHGRGRNVTQALITSGKYDQQSLPSSPFASFLDYNEKSESCNCYYSL
jgi:hypothetical protein